MSKKSPSKPRAKAGGSTVAASPMPARARIMLVEDNPGVQRTLVRAFRAEADIVVYATLREAEAHIDEEWDGRIVDVGMPDGDGLAFAQRIVARDSDASVVLFTAAEAHQVYEEANRHGIIYAHKTDDIALLRRVVAMWVRAARRRTGSSPLTRLDQLARRVGLAPREHEVVRLAMDGLSRREASAQMGISEGAHKNLVSRLLKKTGHKRMRQLLAELSREDL